MIAFNILLAGCTIQLLHAQSKIQGMVTDSNSQPIPNATVLLLRSGDSALVKGTVSGNTGSYLFNNIATGKYLLSFTFSGFKQVYTSSYTIAGNQDNIHVGETRLMAENAQLSNVTVTAKKPLFEQKIDRMVINVRNSITAAGATALDILERSPGVTVDRQNNQLSMGGKDGVLVMVNGKESHMPVAAVIQMLAGMNSGNIERIELITTPPANFSAEGNAGIINIVMVENNSFGTNGSFAITTGVGKSKTASASLNFNHRKKRFNLFGDYAFTINNQLQPLNTYRKIIYGGKTTETYITNDRDAMVKNFNGRMGIDFQITKKTTVGAMISGYTDKWTMDAINQTSILLDQQPDTSIYVKNKETNYWKSFTANLNARHLFKNGGTLSLNLDHLYYHDSNPNYYLNTYFNGSGGFGYKQEATSEKTTPITFWVTSGDYAKKLNKQIELQAGAKFTRSGFNNNIVIARLLQDTWVTDTSVSANYTLEETIAAAYISFIANPNPKTSIKIGLRYEYTNSNLGTPDVKNIVDRQYGKLFPSFFISRKIKDNKAINFSYSRRITRPGFNDLAPFTVFTDPNTLITGNPALQASIADAVSSAYVYKNYIFSLSYSHEAGSIARFQARIDPATNKQVSSPENLTNLKTLALTFSIPLAVTAWWNMQYNLIGRWQQTNSAYLGTGISVEQKNYRISCAQNFKLSKNFAIDVSGYYQSGELRGRGFLRPVGAADFGIQKKTEKGKGKLSFTVTDIFNSIKLRGYVDLPDQNLVMRRNAQFTQRMFKLTYSRSFGNSKLEAKRNRTDSSEEERKRVE